MYAICRDMDEPTAISCVAYCKLLPTEDNQLIVAANTLLRVYRLNPYIRRTSKLGDSSDILDADGLCTRLECVLSVSLQGSVVSMKPVSIVGYPVDALALSFLDAKVAVVAYDEKVHGLKTLTFHCFEDEILREDCETVYRVMMTVDPDNRCLALSVYGRNVGVVPLTPALAPGEHFDHGRGAMGDSNMPDFIASRSYVIPFNSIDVRMFHVVDLCFLHNFHEPTLLILYESIQTSASRVVIRKDTFSIAAISLNLKDHSQAIIWSVSHLPYDCIALKAIPPPVGGVLVIAMNAMIYMHQSVPSCGVLLNDNGRTSSDYPLYSSTHLKISLDGSCADYLSPTVLMLVLRSGEMYTVTLLVDSMHAVRDLHFARCGQTVIPSAVCACGTGFVLVTSTVSDSELFAYRSADRVKVEMREEMLRSGNLADAAMIDDVELYGEHIITSKLQSVDVIEYEYKLCDRICNFAPIRDMTVAQGADLENELTNGVDPIVDLVCSIGHGQSGALLVLQRSVRPLLLTSTRIPGAWRFWCVGCHVQPLEQVTDEADDFYSLSAQRYLLISKSESTMVLELTTEITELEESGFVMDELTVVSGSLLGGEYIVQVTPTKVVLLCESICVQEIALNSTYVICDACVVDPFVSLLTEYGRILLLELVQKGDVFRLQYTDPEVHQTIPAVAVSIYKDTSGQFVPCSAYTGVMKASVDKVDDMVGDPSSTDQSRLETSNDSLPPETTVSSMEMSADEEDFLLYGEKIDSEAWAEESTDMTTLSKQTLSGAGPVSAEPWTQTAIVTPKYLSDPATIRPTCWLFVCRANGMLEILSLPDYTLVYVVKDFSLGAGILYDTDPVQLSLNPDEADEQDYLKRDANIQEILVVGLGANKARPYLFALVRDRLMIYEAFPCPGGPAADHVAVRFKRIPCNAIVKSQNAVCNISKRLFYFENIGGYSGVFIAGTYPYWCVMTDQGILRVHPMNMDGEVKSFTSFHNPNCVRGFIYFNGDNQMRICQLPSVMNYGTSCPSRKVKLNCTVHFVVYLRESHTFAVALSTKTVCQKVVSLLGEEKHFDTYDTESENFIYPQMDMFTVALLSSETFTSIPGAEIVLDEFEHVTVFTEVQLKSEGTKSGFQNYIAFGTMCNYNDEVLIRGKLYIVDVIEVVPEPDQPLTKNKFKVLYSKEQKGPVTSLCAAEGFLLTGQGQKVYIWAFRDSELVGISFLDLHIYVHRMVSIHNLILVGDAFQSVSLLRYQKEFKSLSLASRDPIHMEVTAVDFVVDNTRLSFFASDADGNIFVYCLELESKESSGGLVRKADMHVGAMVTCSLRLRSHISEMPKQSRDTFSKRHALYLGCNDGSFKCLFPVQEKTYRRLLLMQSMMDSVVPHLAGLNPKSQRLVQTRNNQLYNAQKNILNGNLLFHYLSVDDQVKKEVADCIGATHQQLFEDLAELQRLTTHF